MSVTEAGGGHADEGAAGTRSPSRGLGVAAFLRNVPVLSELPEEQLRRLAGCVREVSVRAGAWLMRQGDAADALYMVRSGRLEVLDEGPPEVLIRTLRRGDVIGELALLRRDTRSASVRAQRDSDLIELDRADFEALIQRAPEFALGLTRAMGAQLAATRMPVAAVAPPRTIAVLDADGACQAPAFADALAVALAGHGSAVCLSAGDLAAIDAAERDCERVILACSGGEDDWTELCVTEAHLVVAVTRGGIAPRWRANAAALHGCELLATGRIQSDVLDLLLPREAQVIGPGRRLEAIAALARRLSGRSPGLVLSGGGAAAFAHLGVLEELSAAGVGFDRVGGVSLGALVAAAVAIDLPAAQIREIFERNFLRGHPSNDFAPPLYSLVRGGKARRLLHEAVGDLAIEELPHRFFCISCDLVSQGEVVHRTGPAADALYASLAIPGVFPPLATPDGRLLVDGGVLDNLPVATMARAGEGPIVAVDVTAGLGRSVRVAGGALERAWRPVRRALTGNELATPHIGATIVRSVIAGRADTAAAARLHADLVIAPQVAGISPLDWKSLPRAVELGRSAARAAIEASPDALARLAA